MLNWLWGLMIIIGVSYGIVTGNAEAVSNASIDGAKDAVTMSITMLGIMAMWTGVMEIAKESGLMDRMTKGLYPVLHFLFPAIPKGHKVNEYIAANIIANILGLGCNANGAKSDERVSRFAKRKTSTAECTGKMVSDGF